MLQTLTAAPSSDLVTMKVAGQPFGIPVESVRDIIGGQAISAVPLAPAAIAGSLNLRGRIVTVIDVRVVLDSGKIEKPEEAMNIVIDQKGELYSLLVDEVGEVLPVGSGTIEPNPQTLSDKWKQISAGIMKLQNDLILLLLPGALLRMAIGLDRAEIEQ